MAIDDETLTPTEFLEGDQVEGLIVKLFLIHLMNDHGPIMDQGYQPVENRWNGLQFYRGSVFECFWVVYWLWVDPFIGEFPLMTTINKSLLKILHT